MQSKAKSEKPKSNSSKTSLTLTLSSSVLAGVVALSGSTEAVNAEEANFDRQEFENLHEQLNEMTTSTESEEAAEEEQEAAVSEEEKSEEIDQIKEQLVDMIRRAGGEDILAQVNIEQLSSSDLDNIFEALLTRQVEEREEEETEETTESADESSAEEEEDSAQEETQEEQSEADEDVLEENQNESSDQTEGEEASQEEQSESEEEHTEEAEESTDTQEDSSEDSEEQSTSTESSESESSEEVSQEQEEELSEESEAEDSGETDEETSESEVNEDSETDSPDSETEGEGEETNASADGVSVEEEEDSVEEETQEEQTDEDVLEEEEESNESQELAEEDLEDQEEANEQEEASEQEDLEEQEASQEQEDSESQEAAEEQEEEETDTQESSEAQVQTFAAQSASQADNSQPRTYTVRAGDTLNRIAQRNNISVNELVRLNLISNPNRISVGQVLALNEAAQGQSTSGSNSSSNGSLGQTQTSAQFIEEAGRHARRVAQERGVYASVMIAQAALESGYGRSSLSLPPNYNLFGIKGSYNGQSVTVTTREYYSDRGWVTIRDNFKRYPSFEESFQDNASLLRRGTSWDPGYYSGAWVENTNSYRDATAWLQGRYATDPTYASKLNRIIELYNLTRFDAASGNDGNDDTGDNGDSGNNGNTGGNDTPTEPSTPPSEENPSGTSYTVVRGDTLSAIARRYNTTVSAIRSANGLSGDTIYVNQRLSIPGQGNESNTGNNNDSSNSGGGQETSNPSQEGTMYTIVRGDTLFGIARRYNTTVSQLRTMNQLTSDTIYVGRQLRVPNRSNSNTESGGSDTTPSQPSSGTTYTIRPGDTLTRIARENGTSVSALREANNLRSDLIYAGRTLRIPTNGSNNNENSSSSSQSSGRYTIVRGDTLFGIARRYNTSVQRLRSDNNLTSDTIYVGQQLTVPSRSGNTESSGSSNTENSGNGRYTVVRGDTLFAIARRNNTSVQRIKADNRLTSDTIYVGQQLTLNGNSGSTNTSDSSSSGTNQSGTGSYTVVRGDTLSGIARRYNTTVSALRSGNNLSGDTIYVNQRLRLPNGSSSSAGSSTNSGSSSSRNEAANNAYTVVSGDSLYRIAREHNTTVSALREVNQLTGDTIYVGQRLSLPSSGNRSNSSSSGSSSTSNSLEVTYTVRRGDTLSAIARRYNVSVARLQEWNGIENADRLQTNQELIVQLGNSSDQVDARPQTESRSYTVSVGDSLYAIARQRGTTVQQLKERNNLRSDLIFVGQQLSI